MIKPVAQVRLISALKVCGNHRNVGHRNASPAGRMAPPHPPPTPPAPTIQNPFAFALPPLSELSRPSPTFLTFFGNPCLVIFFRVVEPDTALQQEANRNYLKQLLPMAWSHNPLTTLKLVCNLIDRYTGTGKCDRESFYVAMSWLHENHPKTLASNLAAIAGEFSSFEAVLGILYQSLEGQVMEVIDPYNEYKLTECIEDTEKIIAMAKKALERYERDPNFRFLHDRVSDLFADCLKSDIQNFKQLKSKLVRKSQSKLDDVNVDEYCVELTRAGSWCTAVDSLLDCTTMLSESIAKKIFPRISFQGFEEEEAEHADRARELLMEEVLVPLRDPLEIPSYTCNTNRYGYHYPDYSCGDPSPVQKYLEEVKAGGKSKIRAAALLPHEIVEHVCDSDELRQAAELQWKAMVEDVYLKQGKFKSCLAVCDVSGSMMRVPMDVSVGLGLLVSELSEEPWNGKVITFNRNPQLLVVQGDDLWSKCTFMKRMDGQEWHCQVDFRKVFDLILEVAVNANLKPEQMIKKIFVFSIYHDLDEISANNWEIAYEAIQSKFKEKGYVVPDLVVWNLDQEKSTPAVPCTQPGVKMLSGFINNNLVKSFLENNGDIGPDHVMEEALSAKEYHTLVVLD